MEEDLDVFSLDDLLLSSMDEINWNLDSNPGPGLVESSNQETFTDLSTMFLLSQKEAAKQLGMSPSTLSKRWKQVSK